MKPCANLTWLFPEVPYLERFAAARAAGFEGVEVLFPYDDPAPVIVDLLARNDLQMVLINAPPPNYTGRDKGFAAVPGAQDLFRKDFKRALRTAQALGAQHLHLMAGVAEGDAARDVFVENLTWAASEAPKQSLTIEPINPVDMPGYFLADFDLAIEVLAQIDAPNLHLQFDAYHAQRITGDAVAAWECCAARVAHVQVGDDPGRHAPGSGGIDYAELFARMRRDAYAGWIAGEYAPDGATADSLGWMTQMR